MKLFASVGGYFALDIGTTAVRAVQLSGAEGAWTLTHYGTVPIDHSLDSGDDKNASLRAAITAVIGQSGIHAKNVIIGLPSGRVFTSVVDLPNVPSKELASMIERQGRQHSKSDEVVLDWAVLGESASSPSNSEVLMASVPKGFINARVELMKELGLNVVAVEPDALALARALTPSQMSEGCLIIDIGNFASNIVIAHDNAPRSLCSLPIGMQTLVSEVSRGLKVEAVQATQFITKFGMQADKLEGHVRVAMEPIVYKLVAEAVKSISLFQARYPGVKLSMIVLSGYGDAIPKLADFISQRTGMIVELGNPWQEISIGAEDRTQLQSLSSQLAVAIGLAQRGVDT